MDHHLGLWRNYFINNNYPAFLFDRTVRNFLDKIFAPNLKPSCVPREPLYIQLPFLGKQTNKLIDELSNLISRFFPAVEPKFYFRSGNKMASFFKLKTDDILECASVVYQYKCHCCQQCYIGSTMLQLFVRASKHRGISHRTGRHLNNPETSAIRNHSENLDHPIKLDNFSVIERANTVEDIRILESIRIRKDSPEINNNQLSLPLNIVM